MLRFPQNVGILVRSKVFQFLLQFEGLRILETLDIFEIFKIFKNAENIDFQNFHKFSSEILCISLILMLFG